MPWLETAAAPLPRTPGWPRAHLASTDERPGLAPTRALLAFGCRLFVRICGARRRLTRIYQDLSWTAPARRGGGVRRDPEPPAGPVIRNTRSLTCPLASIFLTIKAERWTAPLSTFIHSPSPPRMRRGLDGEPQLDDDRSADVPNVATRGRGGTMSWLVGGGTRCRRSRNSSRSCGALQNVARFSHNILLDLLLRQPRRGAKREDGDCQYLDLASVIVLVSELDISALALPVIFGVDEFEGHGGSLD